MGPRAPPPHAMLLDLLSRSLFAPAPPWAALVLPTSLGAWGVILASYVLGSVPFGLLLGFLKGVDIRTAGSGNIGATNVGRTLGRPWAVLAFLCDFGKGCVPTAILAPLVAEAGGATSTLAVLAGSAAVLGHCYSIFLGFKGGKGVATGCGALVGIDPVIFLVGGLIWLLVVALARMVSLASLALGLSFPITAWLRRGSGGYGIEVVLGGFLLFLLILVRHRANIARIRAGTEPHLGEKPAPSHADSAEQGGIATGQVAQSDQLAASDQRRQG